MFCGATISPLLFTINAREGAFGLAGSVGPAQRPDSGRFQWCANSMPLPASIQSPTPLIASIITRRASDGLFLLCVDGLHLQQVGQMTYKPFLCTLFVN